MVSPRALLKRQRPSNPIDRGVVARMSSDYGPTTAGHHFYGEYHSRDMANRGRTLSAAGKLYNTMEHRYRPGGGRTLSLSASTIFNFSPTVELKAGEDYTFAIWQYLTGSSGGNPGYWRNNTNATGTSFCIYNGTNRRPWIRVNGTDAIKATSGYQVPLNEWSRIVFVVRSGQDASFYVNGVLRHTATHSATTAALTGTNAIYRAWVQYFGNDRPYGDVDETVWLRRAWGGPEVMADYLDSKHNYESAVSMMDRTLPAAAAGGGGGSILPMVQNYAA